MTNEDARFIIKAFYNLSRREALDEEILAGLRKFFNMEPHSSSLELGKELIMRGFVEIVGSNQITEESVKIVKSFEDDDLQYDDDATFDPDQYDQNKYMENNSQRY